MAAVGLLWLWNPPLSISRNLAMISGAIVLLVATTFLPAIFFHLPPWRLALQQDLGVAVPWTHSLQPWLSLENSFLLVATLAWAWHRWNARPSAEQRLFLLQAYAVVVALLAGLVLWRAGHGLHPTQMAEGPAGWGQFANRNQTGTMLALGGLVSFVLGFSLISQQRASGGFWLLAALVELLTMVLNGSRASLALFFVGCVAWLLWTQTWHWRNRWLWVGFSLGLIGASCLALWGEAILQRLMHLAPSDSGLSPDFRTAIYADAWHLIKMAPWNGVGLGNFEGVFNPVREASGALPFRALHPESDWFWSGVELGWLGLLLPAVFLLFLWLETGPQRRCSQLELRKGCWIALGLFVLHSSVDVPAHRWGTLWPAIFLAGLGLDHSSLAAVWRLPPLYGRGLGLVLVLMAGLRWQSASVHPWLPTQASVATVWKKVPPASEPQDRIRLASQALAWAPLDWRFYFVRAQAGLEAGGGEERAAADFQRARYLEATAVEVILAEARIWRRYSAVRTLSAWQEALLRAHGNRDTLYQELLRQPGLEEPLRTGLAAMAGDRFQLRALSVLHASAEDFSARWNELRKENPSLLGVSAEVSRDLLKRWISTGGTEEFLGQWPQVPEWRTVGWLLYAEALAKQGEYGKAWQTAEANAPAPALPKPPTDLSSASAWQAFQRQPKDVMRGLSLYWVQQTNDEAAAAITLEKVAALETAPDYVYYLLAQARRKAGDEAGAWQMMERYLQRLPPENR
jgi:O-antigen ligase